jgi:hypothetical protein
MDSITKNTESARERILQELTEEIEKGKGHERTRKANFTEANEGNEGPAE